MGSGGGGRSSGSLDKEVVKTNKTSVCSFFTPKIPIIPIFLVETVLKCKRYFITMTTKVVESGGNDTVCGEQW